MKVPAQIHHRGFTASAALDERINDELGKLDHFYDRITACRVVVEKPHRHRHGEHFVVKLECTVPGKVLVVDREPAEGNYSREDPYLAVNEAFDELRRQLHDYVKLLRHDVKQRHGATEGQVVKLVPSLECGFIRAPDGRDIYFHANSVLNGGWKTIEVGSKVRFAEEMGEKGPQASSVHLAG